MLIIGNIQLYSCSSPLIVEIFLDCLFSTCSCLISSNIHLILILHSSKASSSTTPRIWCSSIKKNLVFLKLCHLLMQFFTPHAHIGGSRPVDNIDHMRVRHFLSTIQMGKILMDDRWISANNKFLILYSLLASNNPSDDWHKTMLYNCIYCIKVTKGWFITPFCWFIHPSGV